MVTSTWTAPGGATLNGSNPLWIGSAYQSVLEVSSVLTGTYIATAYVAANKAAFIAGSNQSSSGVEGIVICVC